MSGRRLRITLSPAVLRWARERAGLDVDRTAGKVGVSRDRVLEWERSGQISIAQADRLAHHTYTPVGFLYLPEPPDDNLPIPDFRTRGDVPPQRPSPNLIETVHSMQRRQAWMREELIEDDVEPLGFAGAWSTRDAPGQVAEAMREAFGLAPGWAAREQSWADALRRLRNRVEEAGVLVVFNGVVGNNTHRKLDPSEFQGFALVDDYAPLVFINGADFRAAQMFTLAHELVHLFVGEPGVSRSDALQSTTHGTERFCNQAAAEFLISVDELRARWTEGDTLDDSFQTIARRFKVSVLVAARRALEAHLVDREEFRQFYEAYQRDEHHGRRETLGGGDFWSTQNGRIGRRFGAAVVRAVKEGRLLYREAYRLTGLNGDTFNAFVDRLKAPP